MAAQAAVTKAAEQRGWLRDHTYVKLHGDSEEHKALIKLREKYQDILCDTHQVHKMIGCATKIQK